MFHNKRQSLCWLKTRSMVIGDCDSVDDRRPECGSNMHCQPTHVQQRSMKSKTSHWSSWLERLNLIHQHDGRIQSRRSLRPIVFSVSRSTSLPQYVAERIKSNFQRHARSRSTQRYVAFGNAPLRITVTQGRSHMRNETEMKLKQN